jgi:hypothetical protein
MGDLFDNLYRSRYNEAKIEFARNEHGQQPVLDHLYELKALSEAKDLDATWMLQRITRAFRFISFHGIPNAIQPSYSDTDDAGIPFTLAQPVKELIHHRPIFELRVNRQGYGAYRALFFPFDHQGQQILVFTRSVLKSTRSCAEFDQAITMTQEMIPSFITYPRKFINL